MRNSPVIWAIAVVAILMCSPETFARQSDPHDLSGIWSRNAQYWGGGGLSHDAQDRLAKHFKLRLVRDKR